MDYSDERFAKYNPNQGVEQNGGITPEEYQKYLKRKNLSKANQAGRRNKPKVRSRRSRGADRMTWFQQTCDWCEKTFWTNRSNQRFCSNRQKCSNAWFRNNKPEQMERFRETHPGYFAQKYEEWLSDPSNRRSRRRHWKKYYWTHREKRLAESKEWYRRNRAYS